MPASVRLPREYEERLSYLARQTSRSKGILCERDHHGLPRGPGGRLPDRSKIPSEGLWPVYVGIESVITG